MGVYNVPKWSRGPKIALICATSLFLGILMSLFRAANKGNLCVYNIVTTTVSKHHAVSRSIMVFACFLRVFDLSFWFSPAKFAGFFILTLTSTGWMPQIDQAVGTSPPIGSFALGCKE